MNRNRVVPVERQHAPPSMLSVCSGASYGAAAVAQVWQRQTLSVDRDESSAAMRLLRTTKKIYYRLFFAKKFSIEEKNLTVLVSVVENSERHQIVYE